MARLIVNADDFGYTRGINRAVLELHGAGVLTSTTLMACGQAFPEAVACVMDSTVDLAGQSIGRRAQAVTPGSLGIGCHVVLVDGRPSADPRMVSSLLEPLAGGSAPTGRPYSFHHSLTRFVAELLSGRIRENEIECEAVAQIRRLQTAGVPVTHLDTHKHTHMFPGVLRPLLRAALQCGVRAVRNPFEPSWARAATTGASLLRRTQVRWLHSLRGSFRRLVEEAGVLTTDGSLGVLATGSLDAQTLEVLLDAANAHKLVASGQREPVWELVCHPGYQDEALALARTRLQGARETERTSLLASSAALQGFELVHFGQLHD